MKSFCGLLLAIALLGWAVTHLGGCAAILKPCPECHDPNNPADYPPLTDSTRRDAGQGDAR